MLLNEKISLFYFTFLFCLFYTITGKIRLYLGFWRSEVSGDIGTNLTIIESEWMFLAGGSKSNTIPLPVADPGNGAYFQPTLAGDDGLDGFISRFNITELIITDVNEFLNSRENVVSVFPIPTSEKVYLKFEENINFNDGEITIYDALGKQLDNKLISDIKNNLNQYDFTSFPTGIYFMEIKHDDVKITKKIQKIR